MNIDLNVNHHLIDQQGYDTCKTTGWRAQFACPTGKIGWIVGNLMALKNARMNRFAVEMLEIQPEDQTLEIGFGHGKTIRMIAERSAKGFVAGIDISDTMVRQASVRNKSFIKTGRVEVSKASVADIPYEYGRFNKILAVNNFQFWPDPEHNLTEIRRVLQDDGRLVLCLRMHKAGNLAPGFTNQQVEEIAGLVKWTGFRDLKLTNSNAGREATCIIARR